ncbi:transient receptor potential cation channel subfamily M member-like 2 [Ruditapes philippinarum]|uniref:transient receptor potential cation channel subfamily M member-like 2 n=1 Tax=Ruditapes philippinarum TaxID=129788 RepID=UPI00295B4A95|nr:transient receptor potential cation channel subfamily M member-like 2 [Ruditapes philippinarum]
MFLIFMIAGGVTIQAVLYPHWPLTKELIKRVITRPIYGMFLTQVDDLSGDPSCSFEYENTTGYCHAPTYYSGAIYTHQSQQIKDLQKCPVSTFSAYVITLQYLLICKLVLVTLLFAMFALTIGKVDKVASEVWKFQRYALIADFIERFSLPPPFTVFSFLYLFLKAIYNKLKTCQRKSTCCSKGKSKMTNRGKSTLRLQSKIDDTMFWKKVAREYMSIEEAALEKEAMQSKQGDILVMLQEDLRTHRKSMKRLNDRVVELERMMQSSRLYLEDIAHKLEKSDVMGITNVKGRFIHVAARQSPYPSTSLTRFPVFDKYVPWETQYDVYDPKTFTLSPDKFPENEIMYVDDDILEILRCKEERQAVIAAAAAAAGGTGMCEELDRLTPIPEFTAKWNTVTTFKENGERREIDRRSWINVDNQPLRYTIDSLGLPQNPMGRTGMKGKGILWRWGPNHVIKVVVTRWRRKYGPDLNTMTDYLYVEGKRVLEFIAVQKDNFVDSSYSLPGDVLHGMSNPYSILCKSFMSQVFDEQDTGQHNDQSDMIQFFAQFASVVAGGSSSRSSFQVSDLTSSSMRSGPQIGMQPFISASKSNLKAEADAQGFCASLLYKGYLDDPRNTDNAWVETEVWNFHYDIGDTFDLRLAEGLSAKWKEVSPYVKMFGNESVIVQEAARIHDAYH